MALTPPRYKIGDRFTYSPDPTLVGTRAEHIGETVTIAELEKPNPYGWGLPPQYRVAFDTGGTAWAFEDELGPPAGQEISLQ